MPRSLHPTNFVTARKARWRKLRNEGTVECRKARNKRKNRRKLKITRKKHRSKQRKK
jgi:hypothetical protein